MKHIIGNNKILFAGIFLLIAAVAMLAIAYNPLTVMQECNNHRGAIFPPGDGRFEPGSSFSISCHYRQDLGQDLIFWAIIVENADPALIPSRVEIMDPSNNMIASQEFTSATVVLYIKPTSYGVYRATITNLEPLGTAYPPGIDIFVLYGFGHLTSSFPGVKNPLGDVYYGMAYWGYSLILPSLVVIGIAVVRAFVKRVGKMSNQSHE